MTDTARDYKTLTTADTNGMDDLFEIDASLLVSDAPVPPVGRELDVDRGAYISVEEASTRLNLSIRAIQKRLKRGTLKGVKTKVGSAERWLVAVSDINESQYANMDASSEIAYAAIEIVDANHAQVGKKRDANLEMGREQDASISDTYKDSLIKELQAKLEAATFRIGYLQHHVESQEADIKLLTDRQHTTGRWSRFKNWFLGQQAL